MTKAGAFLPELLYRISGQWICLPPLRERTADISDLFAFMLDEMQAETGRGGPPVTPAIREALTGYSWPGNVRELRHLARAYLLSGNAGELISELARRAGRLQQSSGRGDTPGMTLKEQVRRAARRLESDLIRQGLERHGWNRRRTAETLKISYRSLLYKMKYCNIRANADTVPEG
jgi:DNA-binding NtrC family response regulator